MGKLCRLIIFVLLIGVIVLAWMPKAKAQTDNNGFFIITTPATIQLTGQPGALTETEIKLKNTGTKPVRIKVHLMKFSANGENGEAKLSEREPSDDYFDWVKITPDSFEAPVGEWIPIKISINIPANASLGYYLAIAFSQDASQLPDTSSTQVIGSSATLMLLSVPSANENKSLQITSFSSQRAWYEFLPTTFKVTVKNSGNIHVSPTGNIFIKRGNKIIGTLDVNSAGGNILPGSSRSFTVQWRDGFPQYTDKVVNERTVTNKKGEPVQELVWDFSKLNKLRFGKYSAQLLLAYNVNGHDVPLEATVTFWVMPWRIVIGLFIILLLVFIGIWTISKGTWHQFSNRVRKIKRKHSPGD